MEEERSPPRLFFDRDGDERGDTTRHAADGGEERTKEDSGGPWRRPATAGWGDNERMPRLVPRSVLMAYRVSGKTFTNCLRIKDYLN